MPSREPILEFIRLRGVVRANELTAHGFHSQDLTRLVESKQVTRLARGLYSLSTQAPTPWHDFVEISKTVPRAVINLISALAFHQIGTQNAYETWIAIPTGTWTPTRIPHIRATHTAEPFYSSGIEWHTIDEVPVKIYCPAKTVADCFRMRSKVGYDVAIEALREGWREQKFGADELLHYAKVNRVDRVMRPYIEALIL
jgi:predicted transcriptional regulator of viral defense system